MALMALEVDHVFVCTAVGAPAAARLIAAGLTEGEPNTHPGQGTACRRFSFENCMIELIWVADAAEARGEVARGLRLWERWCNAGRGASPFGVILRGGDGCPFHSWTFRPPTMPGLELEIASGTGLDEPMWCYTKGYPRRRPPVHAAGVREVTSVRLTGAAAEGSVTSAMAGVGVIRIEDGVGHAMEIEFDGGRRGGREDLRPELPMVIRF